SVRGAGAYRLPRLGPRSAGGRRSAELRQPQRRHRTGEGHAARGPRAAASGHGARGEADGHDERRGRHRGHAAGPRWRRRQPAGRGGRRRLNALGSPAMNDKAVTAATAARPTVTLKGGEHRRVVAGHPWVFSNEGIMDARTRARAPGSLVAVAGYDGRALGTAMFNPHSLIAARLLSRDPAAAIDQRFLAERLERARALRERLFEQPFYRLVHAEA